MSKRTKTKTAVIVHNGQRRRMSEERVDAIIAQEQVFERNVAELHHKLESDLLKFEHFLLLASEICSASGHRHHADKFAAAAAVSKHDAGEVRRLLIQRDGDPIPF